MREILTFISLSLVLNGVAFASEYGGGSEIEIMELSKGGFSSRSRNISKRFVVIRNQKSFEREFTSYTGTPAEKLDFNSGVVLLASFGRASSTGFSIEIVSVHGFENYANASVVSKVPYGCTVGFSETYPYHFVYVKGVSLVLVTETLESAC